MKILGSTIAQPVIFEPVVNTPALGSFLFIAIGFLLLQLRIGAIKKAVSRRQTALEELRAIKANELFDAGVNRPSAEALSVALVEYESALQNEENMRTLIPGVRLRAPNNVRNSEKDVSAAKQFLGVDLKPTENNVPEASEGKDGLSAGAVAVLVLVALSQIALLYMLSFDPMTASSVFTDLGGAPPANLPRSSW